jgi:hypothetical protein
LMTVSIKQACGYWTLYGAGRLNFVGTMADMSALRFELVQDRCVMESVDDHQIIRELNDSEWAAPF